jgi:hypothetical protein
MTDNDNVVVIARGTFELPPPPAPGTNWDAFETCGYCRAQTGQACRNMQIGRRRGTANEWPHPGRRLRRRSR